MWTCTAVECSYRNLKGFKTLERISYEQNHLVDKVAQERMKILLFWGKYGLSATIDAYSVSERTLYSWRKKYREWWGKTYALSKKKTIPKTRRKRQWNIHVLQRIEELREEVPNLWKEKLHPILKKFCQEKQITCPGISTIGRLIKDLGWLRKDVRKRKVNHRKNILRKPDNLKFSSPGEVVALDSIEVRIEWAMKRYVITVIDLYSRFSYAVVTNSHSSKTAEGVLKWFEAIFPFPIKSILTDNGSEFALNFRKYVEKSKKLHYHTYPCSPNMNAHCERYNRTIREWVLNINRYRLVDLAVANELVSKFLSFYNCRRVHHAFKNKLTPLQKLILYDRVKSYPKNCKTGWTYTNFCIKPWFMLFFIIQIVSLVFRQPE